jgi:hypothetical protein
VPENRPAIPRELRRRVLVEAGHRCAIPTCRNIPVEINHISEWATVKEHTFDNLIALCPNCHARYTKGEIDRKAMLMYKLNLGVVNSRYNDFERRVLEAFGEAWATNPDAREIQLPGGGMGLLYHYLVTDGLIADVTQATIEIMGVPAALTFRITPRGVDFVQKWFTAEPLEG